MKQLVNVKKVEKHKHVVGFEIEVAVAESVSNLAFC